MEYNNRYPKDILDMYLSYNLSEDSNISKTFALQEYNITIMICYSNATSIPYFIVFNNADIYKAKRAARIRMDKAEYLEYTNHTMIASWSLSNDDKKNLIKALNSKIDNITIWDSIIQFWQKEIITRFKSKYKCIKMPNYVKLKDYVPISDENLSRYWSLYPEYGELITNINITAVDSSIGIIAGITNHDSHHPYFLYYKNTQYLMMNNYVHNTSTNYVYRIRINTMEVLSTETHYNNHMVLLDIKDIVWINYCFENQNNCVKLLNYVNSTGSKYNRCGFNFSYIYNHTINNVDAYYWQEYNLGAIFGEKQGASIEFIIGNYVLQLKLIYNQHNEPYFALRERNYMHACKYIRISMLRPEYVYKESNTLWNFTMKYKQTLMNFLNSDCDNTKYGLSNHTMWQYIIRCMNVLRPDFNLSLDLPIPDYTLLKEED